MNPPERRLEAVDLQSGHRIPLDLRRPKASLAEYLGYAPSTGRPMRRDTRDGTEHVGYVFGQGWWELEWVTTETWRGGR